MAVFSANVLVPRAVPDPATDYMLPDAGSLSYGAITSQSALSSTNGVDALLVNGNRDRQMNGNESTRITQDRSHTVGGNQQKKVAGNKTENVVGNFLQTTIGNLHRSIIGATNDLHTAAHTIEHKAQQLIQEPVEYMHDVASHFMKNREHHDEYQFLQVYAGVALNFFGVNLDFKGVQGAGIGLVGEKHGITLWEKDLEADIGELKTKLTALDSKVGAIQPAVYITMLHEVAITQKIIVIGVNQFM